MATITYTDNGEQRTVPMWATEATLLKLVNLMGGTDNGKSLEENNKTLKELLGSIKDLNDTQTNIKEGVEDAGEELVEAVEAVEDNVAKLGFSFQRLGASFGQVGMVLDKILGGALLVAGTAFGVLTAKLIQTGSAFNELSQSGLALEGATSLQIAQFNQLGMSTEEAVKAMINNAQAIRVLGQGGVPALSEEFLALTESGNDLGLSLVDATTLIMDELTMRTKLVNLGALTELQQKRAVSRIAEVNKNQLEYSKALGVSTDVMRDFADTVLGGNKMLMASFITVPNVVRNELTAGLTDFVSGLRAMGGEAGGEIAAAVVEAASMGAVGFSEAAFGFITVLPQLSDNFQGVINDFNSGLLDGKAAAMAITAELGNLTESEKTRVFLLARAGDEQAKMMAEAITQFEQSADRMKDQGVEIEAVQKGMNSFNTLLAKVRGLFSATFNQFMQGFGEGLPEITDMMSDLTTAFSPFLRNILGLEAGTGDLSKDVIGLGKTFAEGLTDKIIDFAEYIAGMVLYLKNYFKMLDGNTIGEKLMTMFKDVGTKMGNAIKDSLIAVFTSKEFAMVVGGAIAAAFTVGALKGLLTKTAGGGARSLGGGMGVGAAKLGKGIGMGLGSIGKGMAGLAAGSAGIPVLLALTAAIIGIGFALRIAAPGIKAFGEAIKFAFEGIAAIVMAVGDSVANIIEKVGENKVAKINARSEAALKSTRATTEAIKELDGAVDADGLMAMGESIDFLGGALGNFASNMDPSLLSSLRQGIAGVFGAGSPVEQVLALSDGADPVKIMDLAKATMATTAANSGATSLDPSLKQGAGSSSSVVNNTTNTTTSADVTNPGDKAFAELIEAQTALQLNALAEMKKQNRILSDIKTNI